MWNVGFYNKAFCQNRTPHSCDLNCVLDHPMAQLNESSLQGIVCYLSIVYSDIGPMKYISACTTIRDIQWNLTNTGLYLGQK